MANPNRAPNGTGHASDFYMACRRGDLMTVNRLLKTMSARQVNTIEESNNSTALHAASFFGHPQVVKRLLEIGADTHAHNGLGFTAEQEAQTQEMKDIFQQSRESKN
jgi:ankyrin repeat protein